MCFRNFYSIGHSLRPQLDKQGHVLRKKCHFSNMVLLVKGGIILVIMPFRQNECQTRIQRTFFSIFLPSPPLPNPYPFVYANSETTHYQYPQLSELILTHLHRSSPHAFYFSAVSSALLTTAVLINKKTKRGTIRRNFLFDSIT